MMAKRSVIGAEPTEVNVRSLITQRILSADTLKWATNFGVSFVFAMLFFRMIEDGQRRSLDSTDKNTQATIEIKEQIKQQLAADVTHVARDDLAARRIDMILLNQGDIAKVQQQTIVLQKDLVSAQAEIAKTLARLLRLAEDQKDRTLPPPAKPSGGSN